MNEEELLRRYGLNPAVEHLGHIHDLLTAQTVLERRSQGSADTEVMK